MKKILKIIPFLIILITIKKTYAYFFTNNEKNFSFKSEEYSFKINTSNGYFNKNNKITILNNKITLPTPIREGYTFSGYSNSVNGNVVYNNNVNINDIKGKQLYAVWNVKKYLVDINPVIEGVTYNSGLNGFTFNVWLNDKLVGQNVIDWNQEVPYGSKIRVKTNNAVGRNTNFDKTIIVNTNNIVINPTWSNNTYESHFYLNGVHKLTTYNKYGSYISTPNTSAQALGYDPNFYYLSGFTPWETWYQPDKAVGFTINISEYKCSASFGSSGASNANYQLNILKNAGYNFCETTNWGSVWCTSNYSNVINLYNNAWNHLPTSGNGYSVYKQISCDSGWSNISRR